MDWRSLRLSGVLAGMAAVCGLAFPLDSAAQSFEVLHGFEAVPSGPAASLVQAADGYLYGTTTQGGDHGQGSVFRVDAAGTVTTIHSFSGPDGRQPQGRLADGGDGFLYGTTYGGGEGSNDGTIFRIDGSGHLTTIRSFERGTFSFGTRPRGGLLRASDGILYGTASAGGPAWASPEGTIFSVDVVSMPGTIRVDVTHFFSTFGSEGLEPRGELVETPQGLICGTTYRGGDAGVGTIFCLDGGAQTLHSFSGGFDGASPSGSLLVGNDGLLYGTTEAGGDFGRGVIFRAYPTTRFVEVLLTVPETSRPANALVQGPDGALYGTMRAGASFAPGGLVFRLNLPFDFSVLHTFADGADPRSGLLLASDGYLYGTTSAGGSSGQGTVFRVGTSGPLTTLHSFASPTRLGGPAALLQASDGYFYGVTALGGSSNLGTVFRMDTAGAVSILHSFDAVDGAEPRGRLIQASDGYLYGTTARGGAFGYGVVFRMDTAGALTVLHSFDPSQGVHPEAGLVQASNGILYGTTAGDSDPFFGAPGSAFAIDTAGNFTHLHAFDGPGERPYAGLIQASDGYLYGTTAHRLSFGGGTVFRLDPASGGVTTLHAFSGFDGANPRASLHEHADGLLYGTTAGGEFDRGSLFRIDRAGNFQSLFFGGIGAHPHAPLVRAADGRLYGVTRDGGDFDAGTAFALDSRTRLFNTVHSFDGANGRHPVSGLTPGADGLLYGTTAAGGPGGAGVIFRMSVRYSDLSLTVSAAPEPVVPGGVLTYRLTVTNGGPSAATSIALTDRYPSALVFRGGPPECYNVGLVSCVIPALAAGASATFDIEFVVRGEPGTVLHNSADVQMLDDSDPNLANNVVETATPVVAPGITVLAPRAGVLWAIGATRTIAWTHNLGPAAVFTIHVHRDFDRETIAFEVPAESATTGRYQWVVTGPISDNVRIVIDTAPAVADSGPFTIAEPFVPGAEMLIQTVSGNGWRLYDGDFGPPTQAAQDPTFVVVQYWFGFSVPPVISLGDGINHRIRQIGGPGGLIFTYAGDGTEGYSGDQGPAFAAQLGHPSAGVGTPGRHLYFTDASFGVVRRIDGDTGTITTVAGNGSNGYGGDGGPATSASLDGPLGVAVDPDGNVFIADTRNHRIRRVDAVTGIIETIAGSGAPGFGGDGGPASAAQVSFPAGLALDADGNLYLADSGNHRVRRIALAGGVITTVAGDGVAGGSGDGGAAISARLSSPQAVAVDASGALLIADTGNHRLRHVDAGSGIIHTVAGDGTPGFAGDGGPAANARLHGPLGLTVDVRGRVFFADGPNARVRRVAPPDSDASVTIDDGRTTVAPGETVAYTIVVANAGPRSQEALRVSSELPASLTGASWTCTGTPGSSCSPSGTGPIDDIAFLPAGGSLVYVLTATVDPQAAGAVDLVVRLRPPGDVTDPAGNNTATDTNTVLVVADLAVAKTDGLESAIPGQATTYAITVTNAGPGAVSQARVSDSLPAALLSATWTCQAAGGATCLAGGSGSIDDTVALPAGSSLSYSVSATIDPSATGTLTNTVTVSAPAPVTDPVPSNDSATDSTTLGPLPSVRVTVPNTAVEWRINSIQHIRWAHTLGDGQSIRLELSRNGVAGPWETLGTALASAGTFAWKVTGPPTAGALARVRISWAADPSVADVSDTGFTILHRLSLTAPNTPVAWRIGQVEQIRFAHNAGEGRRVRVEVSRNGGATYAEIAVVRTTAAEGTQEVSWCVTGPRTDHARVRVTWLGSSPLVQDASDTDFRIVR